MILNREQSFFILSDVREGKTSYGSKLGKQNEIQRLEKHE